jgi:lipase
MAVLHVYEWGEPSGPPVVCVHGLTGHGRRFEGLAEHLGVRRVVAVDLRGHGHSTWEAPWNIATHLDDLVETADAIGVQAAVWIGHSFGGRLVAEIAARDPERIARAVLLDPAMHIDPPIATERAALLFGELSFESAEAAIDARHADPTLRSTPRATIVREAELHLEQGGDGRFRWRYSPAMATVAWSELAMPPPPWPACPTLVVLGAQSWIPNPVPRLPHLTNISVPGGHSVLWDDPDATADAIAGFVDADQVATRSASTSRS